MRNVLVSTALALGIAGCASSPAPMVLLKPKSVSAQHDERLRAECHAKGEKLARADKALNEDADRNTAVIAASGTSGGFIGAFTGAMVGEAIKEGRIDEVAKAHAGRCLRKMGYKPG